ncbi:RraA family protein [Pirellulales bacterium]|nr:RraA family protein [Pirellulales bacterium]
MTRDEQNRVDPAPCDWIAWGSAAASDALRNLGKPFQAMEGGIRPLANEMATAGPAYTVRCYPGATWALEKALEAAASGDVIVVDAGGRSDVIIMGGLMATRAAARGIAGVIVDGAVRDIPDIVATGLPVFSRYICPRAGTHAEIGEWQTTICCGRLPVRPGDWVVADQTGIVVVPQEICGDAAKQARDIWRHEQIMAEKLTAGSTLAEAADEARSGQAE